MSRTRTLLRPLGIAAVLAVGAVGATACGDDDEAPREPSPGTTAPFVDPPSTDTLDSTGGAGDTGDTVLNNQPTSPAVNNAPPDSEGTG
jgi:hypothetical protein